jgi:hypothetical protein
MAVAWLSTEDSSDEVLEHYRLVLEEQGLPAIGMRYNANAGFVGYWSPSSEEVYLVSAIAQHGETLVLVSAGQVGALAKGTGYVPTWIPLPARIEQRVGLSLALEGATQYTVSGIVPGSSLEEAADTYRSMLVGQGWDVESLGLSAEGGAEFKLLRGPVQGTASLQRRPPASDVHLFLSFLERP